MPSKPHSPAALPFLTNELLAFKRAVEEWTGKEITNDTLDHATELYNTNRRLMIVGSENDDTDFLNLVESLGAVVVADDHCTGSRYFLVETRAEGDRIVAIARRYLSRIPCPQKDYERRTRWQHILKMANEYKVQGILMIHQKFCDPHELDIPPLINFLKEKNIPSLFLEFDVTIPTGQFRTRLEAFLEVLKMRELEF